MTQRERAEELIWRYYNILEHTLNEEYSQHDWGIAKGCALEAVDEVIKALIYPPNPNEWRQTVHINTITWWKGVKTEIENI